MDIFYVLFIYSQTYIKRSPLRQRKSGLLRKVASSTRLHLCGMFLSQDKKRWPFNAYDCLIEVTSWVMWNILLHRKKMWPFNAGDCLIEVIAWTVTRQDNVTFQCRWLLNRGGRMDRFDCIFFPASWYKILMFVILYLFS